MDKRYGMLIEALGGTAKDLSRLVRPVDEVQAKLRPEPTATVWPWSVAMVIAHLAYIEPLFRARLQRIVEIDNPHEPFINPDEAEHAASAAQHSLAGLMELFKAERVVTTSFLQTLTQAQWLRVCTHATFGVTRLRKQVEILIGHDNEHLAQIVTVREWLDRQNARLGTGD